MVYEKRAFCNGHITKGFFIIYGIIIIDIYFHIKYNVDTHKEKVIL